MSNPHDEFAASTARRIEQLNRDGAAMMAAKYTVENEPDYARTYDEDEPVTIRRGDLRALLDVATGSMDFGSGFLDNEQVEALRKVASVLGVDPIIVTPSNFVCQYGGEHQWRPTYNPLHQRGPTGEEREAEAELLARLDAAKTEVFASRVPAEDALAGLKLIEQEVNEFREAMRAREATEVDTMTWVAPEHRVPVAEFCVLCRHTRPLPAD